MSATHEQIVRTLVAAFRPPRWDDTSTATYAMDLADIDPDVLTVVAQDLRRSARYMPTIGELRAAALALTGDRVPDVGDAWAEVQHALRHVGRYGVPDWSHPVIERTVEALGGWHALCNANDEQPWTRRDFERTFNRYAEREQHDAITGPVLGALVGSMFQLPEGGTDD
jgi:hypothetical protein